MCFRRLENDVRLILNYSGQLKERAGLLVSRSLTLTHPERQALFDDFPRIPKKKLPKYHASYRRIF